MKKKSKRAKTSKPIDYKKINFFKIVPFALWKKIVFLLHFDFTVTFFTFPFCKKKNIIGKNKREQNLLKVIY